MRLAIMQPYFFPYLGYFQLISSVEKYLILDDVNYIVRGWVNRNQLLNNGKPQWMTLSVIEASQNKLINEIEVDRRLQWRAKLVNLFNAGYRKAPSRDLALDLLQTTLNSDRGKLSELLAFSIELTCNLLGIATEIVPSTSVFAKEGLRGQDRILDLCQRNNASVYINPPGGRGLYDTSTFKSIGVDLRFLQPTLPVYDQGGAEWTPGMSILDVIAWNSVERVRQMLSLSSVVP